MIKALWQFLTPPASHLSGREKMLSAFVAGLAIALVAGISHAAAGAQTAHWIVASTGAAAVLLFISPQGAFSQPWPLIMGHLVSAFTGLSCLFYLPSEIAAAAVAVAGAMALMHVFRCMHPPGGAIALATATAGDSVREAGYLFLLYPVMLNVAVLAVAALVLNNAIPGRRYPPRAPVGGRTKRQAIPSMSEESGLTTDDIMAAFRQHTDMLDISETQLGEIVRQAQSRMHKRRLGERLCRDIMRPHTTPFRYGTPLAEAWQRMEREKLDTAPITDGFGHVIGVISAGDFVRGAVKQEETTPLEKIAALLRPSGSLHSDKAEVVGQIMSPPPPMVPASSHIVDIAQNPDLAAYAELIVVDERQRLLGLITTGELLRALTLEGD